MSDMVSRMEGIQLGGGSLPVADDGGVGGDDDGGVGGDDDGSRAGRRGEMFQTNSTTNPSNPSGELASSKRKISSPQSQPQQSPRQHQISSFPPNLENNEARQDAFSINKFASDGVAKNYSLTPPTINSTTNTTTSTAAFSSHHHHHHHHHHQPYTSRPPSPSTDAVQQPKSKSKRARSKSNTTTATTTTTTTASHNVLATDVEQDGRKEKSTRKRTATGKNASTTTTTNGSKKGKLKNADALVDHVQSESTDDRTSKSTNDDAATIQPTSESQSFDHYPIRNHDTQMGDADSKPTESTATSTTTSNGPSVGMSYDPVRMMMVPRKESVPSYNTTPPTTSNSTVLKRPAPSASPTPTSLPRESAAHPPSTNGAAQPGSLPGPDAAAETTEAKPRSTSPANLHPSPTKPAPQTKKVSSNATSTAPSPKPTRNKEQPPPLPLPSGSGLLSSTLFGGSGGGGSSSSTGNATTSSEKAPTVYVQVTLPKAENNIINFAQLAEAKYGFAALHPRLAAHKERLAKIAAASAALEKSAGGGKLNGIAAGDSGEDDLSVDVDRESDNDGDVAMTGAPGQGTAPNSGTDGAGTKKRRKRKVEEYDQDDPFVDDSEMAWEAQAAAAKDGFFVYYGPLVPEGTKAAVERYVLCCMFLPLARDFFFLPGEGGNASCLSPLWLA